MGSEESRALGYIVEVLTPDAFVERDPGAVIDGLELDAAGWVLGDVA